MADNDQSKIRYDDFVNSVQPDPDKPESTIMLSGYVGRGPEGYVRVYPDPTLGTWYDLPVADVVYSMPVPDSKLGGSHIWVRPSADIKPGSAEPAAQPQAMAAAAAPEVAPQPTPTVQTHCFICPPPHLTQGAVCQIQPTPTVQTHCFVCPPHQTLATVCTQIQCPTHPFPCGETLLPTPQTHCFICPPHTQAINCPTNPVPCDTLLPTPQTHCFICPPHQTLATVCTQFACPTHPVVCNIQPTHQFVCQPIQTQPGACGVLPPSFGCTQGCPIGPQQGGAQPQAMAAAIAPQPTPTVQTHCFVCPPHQTLATVCTQIHCPTHAVACPPPQPTLHTLCCPPHQTPATVCTQFACPTHPLVCTIQPTHQFVCQPIFTQPVACGVLPPSFGCTQGCQFGPQGGAPQAQPQAMAAAVQGPPLPGPGGGGLRTTWFDCHTNVAGCTVHICAQQGAQQVAQPHLTLATICTQAPACPPHTVHNSQCICPTPSAVGQCGPHPTLATICTQAPACPPHTVHNSQCICPTPSAVGQCGPHLSAATVCTLPPGCPPPHTLPAVCHHTLNIACAGPQNTHFFCVQTGNIGCQPPFTMGGCPPLTPNGVFTPFGR